MAEAENQDHEKEGDGVGNDEYSRLCKCDGLKDKKILKEILGYRYAKIGNRHLGCGGNGYVIKALDSKVNRHVVIKILPKNKTDQEDFPNIEMQISELNILKTINEVSGREKIRLFSVMEDYIVSDNWLGIVFPFYGPNLYNIQNQRGKLPLMWENVIEIAYQLLQALNFLHENGIAHMDIKPGNIVTLSGETREHTVENAFYEGGQFFHQEFLELQDPRIRILDFGSSAFMGSDGIIADLHSNSFPYRAPELILGLPCTKECDKWSAGCTIMELYFALTMFPVEDDIDHLVAIQNTIGAIPDCMTDNAKLVHNTNSLTQTIEIRNKYNDKKFKTLKEWFIFGPNKTWKNHFCRLMQSLLVVNPEDRISIQSALNLPIFYEVPDYLRNDLIE